ncbi:MAG: hypothetical protein ACLTQI_04050 [Slackia sp.]
MWSSWASVHWGYSPRSGCSSASLAVVNGHSYKEKKFENTNLAILCSHDFREPFDRSTTYVQKIGELANMLGDGRILVQVLAISLMASEPGKTNLTGRTSARRCPTLWRAISRARCRTELMTSIMNFMLAVDEAIPGFAAGETSVVRARGGRMRAIAERAESPV